MKSRFYKRNLMLMLSVLSAAILISCGQKKVQETPFDSYVKNMKNRAEQFIEKTNYDSALIVYQAVADTLISVKGENSAEYADILYEIGNTISDNGDYAKAGEYLKRCATLRKKIFTENSIEYCMAINKISDTYLSIFDLDSADFYLNEVKDIFEKNLDTDNAEYAITLNNIGLLLAYRHQFEESADVLKKAVNIYERIGYKNLNSEQKYEYTVALTNVGYSISNLAKFEEALEYYDRVLKIRIELNGENSVGCAYTYSKLASIYFYLGNYDKSANLFSKSSDIFYNIYGEKHPSYWASVNNVATCYNQNKNSEKALPYFLKVIELYPDNYSRKILAQTLANTGACYNNLNDNDNALKYYTLAYDIYKNELHEDDYRLLLNIASLYEENLKDYNKSLSFCDEALDIFLKSYSMNHPDYLSFLKQYYIIYYFKNEPLKAYTYQKAMTDQLLSNAKGFFKFLTEDERLIKWKSDYNVYLNDALCRYYLYFCPAENGKYYDSEAVGDLYDLLLFSKGVLLHSSKSLSDIIEESGDKDLINDFNKLKDNQLALTEERSYSESGRKIDTDSLQNEVEKLEKSILLRSKSYSDYAKSLMANWKDVQNQLNEDEIAVEYFDIINWQATSAEEEILYGAVLLKRGWKNPVMVPLFDGKSLDSIGYHANLSKDELNALLSSTSIYDLTWKPLEKYISGCSTIYFSPADVLHQIPIENIPDGNGKMMSEKYSTCRLSSTKQLLDNEGRREIKTAALFGDIDYDASVKSLKKEAQKYDLQSVTRGDFEADSLMRAFVKRWNALPNSKKEVADINGILSESNVKTKSFEDIEGTEESFKSLSGTKPDLIHVATHGFYFSRYDKDGKPLYKDLNINDNENNMINSGLIFAGANNKWLGKKTDDKIDDGTLTSQEISFLDFRDTEIVVLSACQSGLGDNVREEGIFGLQRAFKKAGVNTIIMSLWEVNDESTQIMMTAFYRYYFLSKEPLHKALAHAQEAVKEKYPAPYFWAGFVILD